MTPNSEFRYYDHYYDDLRERSYLMGLAEIVLLSPDAIYHDSKSGNSVAVKRVYVLGKDRDVEVAYTIEEDVTWVKNISLIKARQQQNRKQSGRWVPYEHETEL